MSTAAKITVDLETRTQGWTAGLNKAGGEVSKWAKETGDKLKALSFSDGFNAAGIAKFSGALASTAKEAAEFATAIRTGASWNETLAKSIDKIPIVGKFRQAGEALNELVMGHKAHRIELEKTNQHLIMLADNYTKLNSKAQIRGKYGEERQKQAAQNELDNSLGGLGDQKTALAMSISEREEKFSKLTYIASKAQKEELKRDKDKLKLIEAQQKDLVEERDQKFKDIERESAHGQQEFIRTMGNQTEELEARMQEKALRRQGKGIESAVVAIKSAVKVRISDLKESVSDFSLAGMDEGRANERRKAVAKTIEQIEAESADTIDELKTERAKKDIKIALDTGMELAGKAVEQAHKERETALENAEKLKEIESTAAIDRLKISDDEINAQNEKRGNAARSHLAESAQIEEDYRRQIADIDKRNREEHKASEITPDENYKAQLAAAELERKNRLDLMGTKEGIDAAKRQEDSLREQRKLWEQVGEPAQKYAGHLADINEQYAKFHDKKLMDAQLKDLDAKTFAELKRMNPDHETPIELYGRTGSFKDVKVGGAGEAMAKQQLEEMKKQNVKGDQWSIYFRDIWQYIREKTGGIVPEIGFNP